MTSLSRLGETTLNQESYKWKDKEQGDVEQQQSDPHPLSRLIAPGSDQTNQRNRTSTCCQKVRNRSNGMTTDFLYPEGLIYL